MANTYFRRTPSTTGTPTKMTYSVWIKRTLLGSAQSIIGAAKTSDSSNYKCALYFNSNDRIQFEQYGTGLHFNYQTTARYSDTSGWYHFVLAYDSTAAGAGDRIKMYMNGVEISDWTTETNPSTDQVCYLGSTQDYFTDIGDTIDYDAFNGYMSQCAFIDGTAYAASDFGSTDATTGEWKPNGDGSIRSLTMGTNGFLLTFENASNPGYDYQTAARGGTTNDYTKNGDGYQSKSNPSNSGLTLNCNWNSAGWWNSSFGGDSGKQNFLKFAGTGSGQPSSAHAASIGTFATNKMPFYYEVEIAGVADIMFGVMTIPPAGNNAQSYNDTGAYGLYPYSGSANYISAGSWTSQTDYQGTATYMIACDPTNNKMWLGKNGPWDGDPSAGTGNRFTLAADQEYAVSVHNATSTSGNVANFNFGNGYFGSVSAGATNADAAGHGVFKYTVPTGFYTFNLKNLKTYG